VVTTLARAGAGLAVVLALVVAPPALAGPPTDQLKGSIERVLQVLADQTLKGDAKAAERRQKIRAAANEIFDFPEIARRTLGRHWTTLTEPQRKEFVTLFSDLLERSYVTRIEQYGGEKIVYASERGEGDLTNVGTKILTKGGSEVPVDYRMARRGDRWLVYDVNVEGVSLVSNYRTQFNRIIQTEGAAELLKRLRTKQDELAVESNAPGRKAAPKP
jgi:phospholipid transport system substrate-binding protein